MVCCACATTSSTIDSTSTVTHDTTLKFSNLVTPNGDGYNDRSGHQVYHHRNIATDDDWWNPAAQRAPSGTYFYYFKAHGINIHTQHTGVIEVLGDK